MTWAPAAPEPERAPATSVWERLEFAVTLLLMFWFTEGWVSVIGGGPHAGLDADALRNLWFPAYGVIIALSLAHVARFGSIVVGLVLGAPIVVLAFASSEWSILPDVTQRRAFALAVTSLFGFYLAARYSWRELIELTAGALLLAAVGSLIAAVLYPGMGVDQDVHVGAWEGLFGHKNQLGGWMVRAAHACLCAAIFVPSRRLFWSGGALLSAGLVAASTSTTALAALVLTVGGVAGVGALRTRGAAAVAVLWLAAIVVAGVAAAVWLVPDAVFGLVGKDATLTGRTEIWELLDQRVQERPLLGYGFGAFWADPDYGPSAVLAQQLDWAVPSAHNGWLETMLQLGKVGVAVFAVHFAITSAAALGRLWSGPEAYWAPVTLLLLLLFSVSESTIIQQNNLLWTLYLATAAKLLQLPVRSREPAPAAPRPSYEATRLA
jgi:O-antigen ligase